MINSWSIHDPSNTWPKWFIYYQQPIHNNMPLAVHVNSMSWPVIICFVCIFNRSPHINFRCLTLPPHWHLSVPFWHLCLKLFTLRARHHFTSLSCFHCKYNFVCVGCADLSGMGVYDNLMQMFFTRGIQTFHLMYLYTKVHKLFGVFPMEIFHIQFIPQNLGKHYVRFCWYSDTKCFNMNEYFIQNMSRHWWEVRQAGPGPR